ncbi:PepSY domain-containing protein [Sandarakinorhabdus sp. DWP1-3-1]|uniref:PepSY domain-containing protein n=1 Tax=Sandarakinorhabdus sp. DWP1-3-1 TaxID=2804627 RepID=UPI003CEF69E6
MNRPLKLLIALAVAAAAPLATPVSAGIEDQVRGLVLAGEIMPFETIRNQVASRVKGDYIGAEFDAATLTYRFRFLVDGSVKNVVVDARTGKRARSANY